MLNPPRFDTAHKNVLKQETFLCNASRDGAFLWCSYGLAKQSIRFSGLLDQCSISKERRNLDSFPDTSNSSQAQLDASPKSKPQNPA